MLKAAISIEEITGQGPDKPKESKGNDLPFDPHRLLDQLKGVVNSNTKTVDVCTLKSSKTESRERTEVVPSTRRYDMSSLATACSMMSRHCRVCEKSSTRWP